MNRRNKFVVKNVKKRPEYRLICTLQPLVLILGIENIY